MTFWKWYWGGNRYILNQVYHVVIVGSIVWFREAPGFYATTIVVTIVLMVWRYRVWKRRNPAEAATGPNPEDEL